MYKVGINPENKRLINKLYKRLITADNIIKIYPHPMQIFFTYLIEGDIKTLCTTSNAVFSPKISTLTTQKS